MKAAAFDYVRATSVDEICRLLADAGDTERKIIAGGQTLVPLMAMRMARPDMLIDINDVKELSGIEDRGDQIAFGAGTRQRAIERSDIVSNRLPLLAKAVRNVGHVQTRNRGTIGGSIVHGDPSAEIPLAALALEARMVLRDTSGVAREFQARRHDGSVFPVEISVGQSGTGGGLNCAEARGSDLLLTDQDGVSL